MLLFIIVTSSCKKDDYNLDSSESYQKPTGLTLNEGQTILGNQLEDPYDIKNMKQAYANLKSSALGVPDLQIESTHKYMRFLPRNENEWSVLKSDTSVILYDYPLDFEIVNAGTSYHDPTLPNSAITWQYCVLPIGYIIPEIQHELIYEVYIPEEDDNTNQKSVSTINEFLAELEYESNRLTGNLTSSEKNLKSTNGLWSKWTPKGTIKVWDNIIGSTTTYTKVFSHYECYDCDTGEPVPCAGVFDPRLRIAAPIDDNICKRAVYNYIPHTTEGMYIPLKQVSVHARWFTNIKTDLTDENGYFETGQFRNDVNYAIKWERSQYDIRDGGLLQAWFNGPKKQGDWNLNIGTGGKSIMYATIHRAAYKQFYGDNLDIRRPTGMGAIKLCYKDEYGTSVFWGDHIDFGIIPDIKIFGKESDGSYKTVDHIFGTTTHELGHLSHWHLIGIDNYAFTGIKIYESWADAVQWALTNDEYHTMGARFGGNAAINYNCPHTNQLKWPVDVTQKEYSPIFIDLMDTYIQRVIKGAGYPNDLISGYTLSYIQNNILRNSRGYSSLRDEVKSHKIAGVTDAMIDELFMLYWSN